MAAPAPVGPPGGRDLRPRPLLRTTIGGVLRRARLLQGRTLADVARIARVSMPYLSELERGRKEASSEVLAAICDALGIDLADLLAEVRRELLASRGRSPVVRLGFQPQSAPTAAAGLSEASPAQAAPSQSDSVASVVPADARGGGSQADVLADLIPADTWVGRDPADVLADLAAADVLAEIPDDDALPGDGEAVLLLGDQSVLLPAGGIDRSPATSPRGRGQAVCQLAA